MNSKTNILNIDKNITIESVDENGLVWLNPNQESFKLVGFNSFEQDKVYRHLPLKPNPTIRQMISNLAFSGNGRGEPEVAEHISRIKNPSMFILDYEANCESPERLAESLPEFIRILRGKHQEIPILLVSKTAYAQEIFNHQGRKTREVCKQIEINSVKHCRDASDKNIHFIDAEFSQGDDFSECTVDGIHATDLGFYRMAENLLPEIQKRLLQ